MRSAAIFAIFGAIAAFVQAFGQEWTLEQTLRYGFGWAAGFGLLGWGIGQAARRIAREALPGEKSPVGDSAAAADDGKEERAWVRPSRRIPGESTPTPGGARSRDRRQDAHRV